MDTAMTDPATDGAAEVQARRRALMEKGLKVNSGQTHVQRYTKPLLEKIEDGTLDTTWLISHRLPLEEAARGYKNFREQQDSWTKVILKPGMEKGAAA